MSLNPIGLVCGAVAVGLAFRGTSPSYKGSPNIFIWAILFGWFAFVALAP